MAKKINSLPEYPSRLTAPGEFSVKGDAWHAAMEVFPDQVNELADELEGNAAAVELARNEAQGFAAGAAESEAKAIAAQNAAVAAVGAGLWVSGASYAKGNTVTSPLTFQQYRAKAAVAGSTVDPSADAANWARVNVAVVPALSATIADASAVVAKCIFSLSDMSDGGAAIRNARHTTWYKEFGPMPEKVGVYATATDVVLRDMTKPNVPVWMPFNGSGGANMAGGSASSGNVTCVAMRGGKLIVGQAQGTSFGNGIVVIDFAKDEAVRYRSISGASFAGRYLGGIGQANDGLGWDGSSVQGIIGGAAVNAVASFTYPDAPCDPETGLPVAAIAVGHASGVSVIKPDGSVFSSSSTEVATKVFYTDEGYLFAYSESYGWVKGYGVAGNLAAGFSHKVLRNHGSTVGLKEALYYGQRGGVGICNGVAVASKSVVSRFDSATDDLPMVSHIAEKYADTQFSGLVGSWLNSNDDADLVGGELVTNGDFSNGLTGWDAGAGVTASGGAAACSGAATILTQSMGLVSGKSYVLTLTYTETSSLRLRVEGSPSGGVLATSGSISGTGSGTLTFNFVAASSGVKIAADGATFTGTIDNVSVRLADPDRSVSGKGLAVYGTVQKSEAVAGSGGLMAYSGFSPTNYLQQPYSSAMDVGTGDFTWVIWGSTTSTATQCLLARQDDGAGATGVGAAVRFGVYSGNIFAAIGGTVLTVAAAIAGAGVRQYVLRRKSGVCEILLDGAVIKSQSVTADLTNAAAVLRVGVQRFNGALVDPFAGWLSGAQVYARGLSNDEISALYRLQRAALHGKTTLRSGDIKSIAADPYTGDLHVLTAVGRQVFDGRTLQETEFEAITGKTKIAVHNRTVSLS